MNRLFHLSNCSFSPLPRTIPALLAFLAIVALCRPASAQQIGREKESTLITLRNGGCIAGITPQLGGRIVVYRRETGANALDERPEQWTDPTPADLGAKPWKPYYGDSVWAGPQSDWWSSREPYPPPAAPGPPSATPHWPPDPHWEMAAYTVLSKSETRVVLQSPVSPLTGLQLTRTVELKPDGTLCLRASATNQGDRVVTRNLWMLIRVPLSVRTFLPLRDSTVDDGFSKIATTGKVDGLTEFRINTQTSLPSGKIHGAGSEGWIAAATDEQFLIIRFPITESAKVPPGCSPIIAFCSTAYSVLELEHHGPLTTLHPGETMTREQTWQIIPNPGLKTAEEQARFLREKVVPLPQSDAK